MRDVPSRFALRFLLATLALSACGALLVGMAGDETDTLQTASTQESAKAVTSWASAPFLALLILGPAAGLVLVLSLREGPRGTRGRFK